MRVLHLTDLHYSLSNKALINRLGEALTSVLQKEVTEKEIDFIVFSGDLVFSGNDNLFEKAESEFIKPLCKAAGVSRERFVLCGGNHDMELEKEFPAVSDYINKFETNDVLDAFVEKRDDQFDNSCLNTRNFNEFVNNYYSDIDGVVVNSLWHSHKIEVAGKKVGIVAFNTAWRSFIGEDKGTLLLPRCSVLQAQEQIRDCDLKVCLMHHDLSDLKAFNLYELEDLIYELFHLKFSGHYHKKRQEAYITPDIGMLSLFSPSSMSKDDGSKIGFTILDLEEEILEGKLINYDYSRSDNLFTKTASIPVNIPVSQEKKDQIDIIKAVKNAYEKELLEANDLLVSDDTTQKDFLDFFSPPLLKSKSRAQTAEDKKDSKRVEFEQLFNGNYIIYGKDKSGKTSLLRKMELELLLEFKFKKIIPLYIDFRSVELGEIDILRLLKQLLGLSNSKINKILKNSSFTLLIDNFNPDKKTHSNTLSYLKKELEINAFILTCEETLTSSFDKLDANIKKSEKLFLHPLTRSEIRKHAEKWLGDDTESEQQEILKKVESLFLQLNIPFNYWSLSLFLWLYKKEKRINIHDNIELVNLYIDGLLERKKLALTAGNIDYDTFRSFLGEFAYSLLKDHSRNNYSMSYEDLVRFVDDYKHKNIRFVAESEELLDFLISRGIIKKHYSNSLYTFRLNGVMEFFLALHMKEDKSFVNDILNDDLFFLEFANEIEIYAGLIKSDEEFLIKVRNRVSKTLDATNKKYAEVEPDEVLIDRIKRVDEVVQLATSLEPEGQVPMEYSKQDDLLDDINPLDGFDGDVRVKKPIQSPEKLSHTDLEKHLFILSRVYRGLSLLKYSDEVDKTFNFILETYINLGFDLLEDIEIEGKNRKEKEKFVIDLLTSFIPLIVQMNLSEAIVHVNLKRLIEVKIDELQGDQKKNEYKLFILYYILLDIDLVGYSHLIPEIVKIFKLFPLKNTSLFKLYYLLLFKANGNRKLQRELKDGIVQQQLLINSKLDKSQIKQEIDRQINLNKHIN